MSTPLVIGLSAVIVAVTDETPRVLVVRRPKYACRVCEEAVVQAPARRG